MSLLLIGAGRMGSALLKGWLKQGIGPVTVVEPKPATDIKRLAKAGKITLVDAPSRVAAKRFSACVVAIKPQILKDDAPLLAHFAASSKGKAGALMISIAAGTDTKRLSKAWGAKARIIRAMPNIPGAIGQGITGLYAGKNVGPADRKRADSLLAALGDTVWVDKEKLIDSVTAISGSGPAYLFLMAEVLTQAAIAEGLPSAQAEKLARATVSGAGAMLAAEKISAADLRIAVTSPAGTTAAALAVLMAKDGLAPLMKRAVHAARKRAEELA